MDGTFRATIGIDAVSQNPQGDVAVKCRNYGTLSATSIKVIEKINQNAFKLTDLRKQEPKSYDSVIFPTQVRNYFLGKGFVDIVPAAIGIAGINLSQDHFVGMIISYKYANNKNSEYGFVSKYDAAAGKYFTTEEST